VSPAEFVRRDVYVSCLGWAILVQNSQTDCKVIIHAFCPPQIGHMCFRSSAYSSFSVASLVLNDPCCIQKL